jgi:polyribonucleotide nucleotidyltransferase
MRNAAKSKADCEGVSIFIESCNVSQFSVEKVSKLTAMERKEIGVGCNLRA